MTRVYETVREAAELWVSQFNAIPPADVEQADVNGAGSVEGGH